MYDQLKKQSIFKILRRKHRWFVIYFFVIICAIQFTFYTFRFRDSVTSYLENGNNSFVTSINELSNVAVNKISKYNVFKVTENKTDITYNNNTIEVSETTAASERIVKNEKLVDLENFTFTINSKVCDSLQHIPVIAVIASAPNNFHKRQAIRKTWGQNTAFLKHVFTFGETDHQDKLVQENNEYGDIIQGNFVDTYRNLTYKHIMALKWVSRYCSNSGFMLKTDDDVFVHLAELKDLVESRLKRDKDMVTCIVTTNGPVIRDRTSKWYVHESEFSGDHYPPYCSGSVIIYSPNVASRLVKAAETERYFYVDDVFVTGILTQKLSISLTEINELYLSSSEAENIMQNGIQEEAKFLFGPININTKSIAKMWKATEEHRTRHIVKY